MKSFLIIGAGNFGHQLCREFAKHKCEVMIVDSKEEYLEDLLPIVTAARIADCTNTETLKSFDIPSFDACFVCVGKSFQYSLEITSLLKELGAKLVFSKADEDIQAKFLLRNGADHVIYPDRDIAARIAFSESHDDLFDVIPMSKEFGIFEISPMDKWIGKSMIELRFRNVYNLSVLAVKKGDEFQPLPGGDYRFAKDEHVLVFGTNRDVSKVLVK